VAELADALASAFSVGEASKLLKDTEHYAALINGVSPHLRKLALLCSFLLIVRLHISRSSAAHTQSVNVVPQSRNAIPDAPNPKVNSKVFIADISLLAASKGSEMWSTIYGSNEF
jgi:hypothetical protein